MIIFLYGQDSFRARLKLNEIIDQYRKVRRSGLNLFYCDFQEDEFLAFKEKLETVPMFAERKLFILENVFLNSDLSKDFLDYMIKNKRNLGDDILVFFEPGDLDRRGSLFSFLTKTAKFQEFKLLDGQSLKQWLKKEAEKLGAEISSSAIEKLVVYFSNDSWRLSNELKKLASFKKGKKIEPEDVELLATPEVAANIFKTIDAVATQDRRKALELTGQHFDEGDSPAYLLAMINYQFRNLLIVKDLLEKGKPLRNSGLNDFVARKCYFLAQKFAFSRLKKIYSKILEIDLKIKTGKISPRQGLELLISEI
ncbi:MAG: DNA polymerase III subunit delta [bacterium]|nr:DNA polymerase III subunit delta [bacterium]